jgi:enoyl-CoA hydratase
VDQLADPPEFMVAWDAGIGVFRINRPRRLNSLTKAVLDGLDRFISEAEAGAARLIVVTASGERAFCAGTDLGEAAQLTLEQQNAKSDYSRDLLLRLSRSRCISIAAINGLAYGGGLELAMACTLRIAAADAMLSLPEIKLGLLPSYGGTQFLPALVGESRALDLMMTGRAITAQEALAMGLVNRVVAGATPIEEAMATATMLAGYSQPALASLRRCVAASGPTVSDEGIAVEAGEAGMITGTADAREGICAFLEKRPPVFNESGGIPGMGG